MQQAKRTCGDWCDFYLQGIDCNSNPYDCSESREVRDSARTKCEVKGCNHLLTDDMFHEPLGCVNPACSAYIGEDRMLAVLRWKANVRKYQSD